MKRFIPSPAMVVGLIALFAATTGVSVAATKVVIKNSKQVKDGALSDKDFSKAALGNLKGNAGPQGPAGATGAQATNLWGVVNFGSPGTVTLTRGSGVTAVAAVGALAGEAKVTFNRDITNCAWLATIGDGSTPDITDDGTITIDRETSTQLLVQTWDNDGTGQEDHDFHIAVFC
jgi:hypothetical protein